MYLAAAQAQVQAGMPGVTYPPPVVLWSADMERPTTGRGRENGVYYAMRNGFFKSLMQALPGFHGSDIDNPNALKDANAIDWYEGMRQNFQLLDNLLKTGGTLVKALGPPTGDPPSGGTAGTFPGFKNAVLTLEKTLTSLQNKSAEMAVAQQPITTSQPAPMTIAPTAASPISQAPTMYDAPQAPSPSPTRRPIVQAGMLDDISPVAIAALFVIPLVIQLIMRRR